MQTTAVPTTMRAVRLGTPGLDGVELESIATPRLQAGEALVRVHAAAITRDELDWSIERLPATPSYELSGVVAALGPGAVGVEAGEAVIALTAFDRDGVAAEYAAVPVDLLVAKPTSLGHVESAAVPLAALSAWQGLFDHGRLEAGEHVVVHGAAGGVGHLAVQLARWRGAHVVERFEDAAAPVDLVFDTAGGELLARSPGRVGAGGRVVSVAEEAPGAQYFIVEPNREQLAEIAGLVDEGALRPAVDSVFPLADARAAFERSTARGKRGKVVLLVADE